MPWKCRRDVVVAHIAKGVDKLKSEDQVFLSDLGFVFAPPSRVSLAGLNLRTRSKPLLGFTGIRYTSSRRLCKSAILRVWSFCYPQSFLIEKF